MYWSPTTEEGKSHFTVPERDFAVIKKPLVSSPSLSFTLPDTECASIKSALPITSNSTVPEEDEAVMRPISLVINDTLPEADFVSAATTFPPIFALTVPEDDSALNITPALRLAITLPEADFSVVSPTTPILFSVMLPDADLTFIEMQFPVKWNAFSDRNGMLFSGLTEWLSDTNGMAQ